MLSVDGMFITVTFARVPGNSLCWGSRVSDGLGAGVGGGGFVLVNGPSGGCQRDRTATHDYRR